MELFLRSLIGLRLPIDLLRPITDYVEDWDDEEMHLSTDDERVVYMGKMVRSKFLRRIRFKCTLYESVYCLHTRVWWVDVIRSDILDWMLRKADVPAHKVVLEYDAQYFTAQP